MGNQPASKRSLPFDRSSHPFFYLIVLSSPHALLLYRTDGRLLFCRDPLPHRIDRRHPQPRHQYRRPHVPRRILFSNDRKRNGRRPPSRPICNLRRHGRSGDWKSKKRHQQSQQNVSDNSSGSQRRWYAPRTQRKRHKNWGQNFSPRRPTCPSRRKSHRRYLLNQYGPSHRRKSSCHKKTGRYCSFRRPQPGRGSSP